MTEWIDTGILRVGDSAYYEYRFDLPRPLADWDVWDYWERPRVHSMRAHLHSGMTLFDVGTEEGWCNLIYASMVGPANMVLVEPSSRFWPNIRATWERNYGDPPRLAYHGFLSDRTTDPRETYENWPEGSVGELSGPGAYENIFTGSEVPQIRLDDLVDRSGVVPDALTIDVEGAELLVLRGAQRTLKGRRPLVWVSVHPDLLARDYNTSDSQVHDFMTAMGYTGQHLGTDHEQHHMFTPR